MRKIIFCGLLFGQCCFAAGSLASFRTEFCHEIWHDNEFWNACLNATSFDKIVDASEKVRQGCRNTEGYGLPENNCDLDHQKLLLLIKAFNLGSDSADCRAPASVTPKK